MLENLKLRGRILLGYAIPIPLSFVLAWLVYSNTNMVRKVIEQSNVSRDALVTTDSIASDASTIEYSMRGYLLTKEDFRITRIVEATQSLEETTKTAQELIESSKNRVFSEEQKKLLNQLLEAANNLKQVDLQIVNLAKAGKMDDALKLFKSDKSTNLIKQIRDANTLFNEKAMKQLKESQLKTTSSLDLLTALAVLGNAFAAIASISIGILLASRIQQTINKTVSAMATSSTEIAASVEQQERAASQQASAVNQTTTTMDELEASSRQSAEQAEAAKVKVQLIADQILGLSEQVTQINDIANLVSDLANQTNMLALNAAVEAVRAGEQGKGFAVVAAEIRRLADQSKQSATKINTLVGDIQNSSYSKAVVNDGTGRGIQSIVNASSNIALSMQQISLNVRQQAIAIEQVVKAMNDLNMSAQQTASGINQTRVSIKQMNAAAQDLKTVVG